MHCPNCGTPAPANQKFCRGCGMSLQSVSEAVAQHRAADQAAAAPAPGADAQEWARTLKRSWGLGFAVLFAGLFIGIVGRKIIHDEVVTAVGALLAVMAMWPLVYPFFSFFQVRERAGRQPRRPAELTQIPTTNQLLDARPEPIFSLAEGTTRSIEPVEVKTERYGQEGVDG